MSNPFDLTGQVAIVTGGNGGIGLGIAKGLAGAGASVAIAGRDAAKNASAVAGIEAAGGTAIPLEVDVVDEGSVAAMTAATLDRFGRIDILVANAGINNRKPPEDYTLAEWREIIDINLTGTFVCATAVHPAFREAGHGKIITIGSMLSLFGGAIAGPYSASKGGVVQLTKSLAVAWAPHGIQVNSILPGFIDTDLTRAGRIKTPEMFARIESDTPAGRWGIPDDLAGLAVFLASSASDFVTGTAIPVDGGYSAQM
ncbi:SDR family NAD(P)-dependent oxidoreductase [Bauldia sp.]|uniref:SDR family NAD(P)-dependent oxidoreductase n=1 Tax=Bauldia sp. TaxID=2575872 RepID=UPI0025C2FE31|nr:glucose 1-dehydrogenase [Bauldia sp.]